MTAEANQPPVSAGKGGSGKYAMRLRGLTKHFGSQLIFENLNLDVFRGEVLAVAGGSGAGKSVLLRTVLGLLPFESGSIEILGKDLKTLNGGERTDLERRWGVLFQDGALFSSLTVLQNVQVPMREHLKLPKKAMDELARLKIAMVGLPATAAGKFPSELSGGMRKRAGLARALALDPGHCVLGRADIGARSHRRCGFRPAHPQFAAYPRPDGLHDYARPRQHLRGMRPGGGARRQAYRARGLAGRPCAKSRTSVGAQLFLRRTGAAYRKGVIAYGN